MSVSGKRHQDPADRPSAVTPAVSRALVQAPQLRSCGGERHLLGVPRERDQLHSAVQQRLLEVRVLRELLCTVAVTGGLQDPVQHPARQKSRLVAASPLRMSVVATKAAQHGKAGGCQPELQLCSRMSYLHSLCRMDACRCQIDAIEALTGSINRSSTSPCGTETDRPCRQHRCCASCRCAARTPTPDLRCGSARYCSSLNRCLMCE